MAGMKDYIQQLEQGSDQAKAEKIHFNLRLDSLDAFKIDTLAQRYGKKKSAFAADILKIAITDAWQAAELGEIENSEELQKQFQSFLRATKKISQNKKKESSV